MGTVLIDGGGRGRTRSVRRAFVCVGLGLLFYGLAEDERASDRRACEKSFIGFFRNPRH